MATQPIGFLCNDSQPYMVKHILVSNGNSDNISEKFNL